MKMTVCKGCGQSMQAIDETGKPACVTCIGLDPDSGIPMEIELPDEILCEICHKKWKVSDVLKTWVNIPFYDSTREVFYDGCRGWD